MKLKKSTTIKVTVTPYGSSKASSLKSGSGCGGGACSGGGACGKSGK